MTEKEKKAQITQAHIDGYNRGYAKAKADLETENNKLLDVINNQDVEIADLEWQLQEVAKDNDYYQAENKRLEKKNAGLVKTAETFQATAYKSSVLFTKAKEIIKKILYEYQRLCLIKKETIAEVEQFLKEIEK